MDELKVLRNKKSTEHTREEQNILNRAYMVATYGEDVVDNIGTERRAITNIKNQIKFRELCSMDEPENGFLHKLFRGDGRSFEYYMDAKHHKPAEQLAIFKIIDGFGFVSLTDKTIITMDDEKRVEIGDAVQGYKRLVKTGRKERPDADSLRSALAILRQQWSVKPIQLGRKGEKAAQYTIGPCGDGLHWGTPTWEKHLSYREFETSLHAPPSKSDDTTDRGIVGLFESMNEATKRKREVEGDGNTNTPKKNS
jgi:hypothetical protein